MASPESPFADGASLLLLSSSEMGIDLDETQLAKFRRYFEMLVDWNSRLNLTRIVAPRDVAILHFLDSLSCLLVMPSDSDRELRVVDVGTGAGFPGLPVKIARERSRLTLIESVSKKVSFLETVVSTLQLSGVTVIQGRAEDVGREREHRQAYDVALARAVAPLATLVELCLPFVRIGGRVIASKTAGIEEELRSAQRAIARLGGRLSEQRRVNLPGLDQPRLLVVVEKIKDTPQAYPRRAGLAAKNPLV